MKAINHPPQFKCANCEKTISWMRPVKLFCSDLCKDEADYVRYYRRCLVDGRIQQMDIQIALRTKRVFLLSGGYNAKIRKLSPDIRETVKEKFNGLCALCGQPGSEIDHVQGPSDDLTNLQFLCHSCHAKKTQAGFTPLTPDDPRYEELTNKAKELDERVYCRTTLRPCDDQDLWNHKYRAILDERKKVYDSWLLKAILPLANQGLSARRITLILNDEKVPTFSGQGKWDNTVVSRILRMGTAKK